MNIVQRSNKLAGGILIIGLVLWIACANSATAETILGRWCDKMVPNNPSFWSVIIIEVQDNGDLAAIVNHRDGSVNESVLEEVGGDVMTVVGSSSGDKYRVVPSTGSLQLLDNDGFIRSAQRLENTPHAGECGE